jgi:TRAP-type mannitol/chloroaromatic compound transport system permease small subunit
VHAIVLGIDRLSSFFGKLFAWCILILTAVICYEVVARYYFRNPTGWAFDVSYMLYGTLFMMAGAYTLCRNGHVRADFAYRLMSARRRATLDLTLYILFFLPAMLGMLYFGWNFFLISYMQNEASSVSPTGPYIWPFKFVIPLASLLVLVQGVAEMLRCVICLRTGDFPPREHDVKEMEELALERAAQQRQAQAASGGAQ